MNLYENTGGYLTGEIDVQAELPLQIESLCESSGGNTADSSDGGIEFQTESTVLMEKPLENHGGSVANETEEENKTLTESSVQSKIPSEISTVTEEQNEVTAEPFTPIDNLPDISDGKTTDNIDQDSNVPTELSLPIEKPSGNTGRFKTNESEPPVAPENPSENSTETEVESKFQAESYTLTENPPENTDGYLKYETENELVAKLCTSTENACDDTDGNVTIQSDVRNDVEESEFRFYFINIFHIEIRVHQYYFNYFIGPTLVLLNRG